MRIEMTCMVSKEIAVHEVESLSACIGSEIKALHLSGYLCRQSVSSKVESITSRRSRLGILSNLELKNLYDVHVEHDTQTFSSRIS